MPKLNGKVALVTGGTSEIGVAAAKALATEGAHMYITGHRERELAAAVEEIGRNASGVRGDVSNVADLERLYAQIRDEKGRLDILGFIAKIDLSMRRQAPGDRGSGVRRLVRLNLPLLPTSLGPSGSFLPLQFVAMSARR